MQWVIETTDKGVRITYLGGKSDRVGADRVREISFHELDKNPKIHLQSESAQSKDALELQIEPAARTLPAYAQNAGAKTQTENRALAIYRTMGQWVIDSQAAEGEYIAQVGGIPVFALNRSGDQFQLFPKTSKLYLVREGLRTELDPAQSLQLSSRELADATIQFGSLGWRFGWILQTASAVPASKLPPIDLGGDLEAPWFKKALTGSAIGLAALILLSLIWPQGNQEELVPPQLAKLILTAPKHAAASSESAPATTAAQKKVQQTAVVQAFRAKALQSAMSNLMKGGMTRLLQQSDFVAGHRNSAEASQLFSARSKEINATAPEIGALGTKSVAVASLGGNGAGDPGAEEKPWATAKASTPAWPTRAKALCRLTSRIPPSKKA